MCVGGEPRSDWFGYCEVSARHSNGHGLNSPPPFFPLPQPASAEMLVQNDGTCVSTHPARSHLDHTSFPPHTPLLALAERHMPPQPGAFILAVIITPMSRLEHLVPVERFFPKR